MPSDSDPARVLEVLAEVPVGRRRLLLIDEADVFVERDAAGTYGQPYAVLNGLCSLSDEGRCHFILAGFWKLYRSASFEFQSPVKNFTETLSVDVLKRDACAVLITEYLSLLNQRRTDSFGLADVLGQLESQAVDVEPERIRESLARLELAFILDRQAGIHHWQVPLWRNLVLAEQPEELLRWE